MLALVGALLLAALASPMAAQERPKVRLLQAFPVLSFAPIYVARARGLFEAEGVDVDVHLVRGASLAFQGLVGGQAPFAVTASTELITGFEKGIRGLVAVASMNRTSFVDITLSKEIATARGLSRAMPLKERLAALKGLRIASGSPGGAIHTGLMYMLKQAGLDPTRDVTLIAMGGTAEMIAALRARQVDAFAGGIPAPETVEAMGLGILYVATSRGEVPELADVVDTSLMVSREYAEKNPAIVRKVVRAVARASNFIQDDPDGTREVMLKFFDKTPPDVWKVVIPGIRNAFPRDARMNEQMWRNAVDFNVKAGKIRAPVDSREGVLWTNAFNRPD